MAKQGAFSDPKDIEWRWIGERMKTENNHKTFYNAAEVVQLSNGSRRTFKVGDAVYVAGEQGQEAWVAQIVEFFELGNAELQLIDDDSEWNPMRCTLRWLYNRSHMDRDSLRLFPEIPRGVRGEVYFSDHVEDSGSNDLEVIEGRAFLFATVRELRTVVDNLKDNPPEDYWEGDAIRLVRCFYGYNSGNPAPIRELEDGELKFLLGNPSLDTKLYRNARPNLYGVTGAVMKGIAKKKTKHSKPTTMHRRSPDGAARHSTRKSPGRSQDHAAQVKEADVSFSLPSSRRMDSTRAESSARPDEGESRKIGLRPPPGKTRRRLVLESSDGDSDEILVAPGPKMRPAAHRVIETIEKSGKVRSSKHKHGGNPSKTPDAPVQSQNRITMKVDKLSHGVMESDEMQAAIQKWGETVNTVPREQQQLVFHNLRNMLNLMTNAMAERNLDFDMKEKDKNEVAKLVAQQIFGNREADSVPDAASSARHNPRHAVVTPESKE